MLWCKSFLWQHEVNGRASACSPAAGHTCVCRVAQQMPWHITSSTAMALRPSFCCLTAQGSLPCQRVLQRRRKEFVLRQVT